MFFFCFFFVIEVGDIVKFRLFLIILNFGIDWVRKLECLDMKFSDKVNLVIRFVFFCFLFVYNRG